MAQFSGAIKIGDLNDFIAPSQACVVSLSGIKETDQTAPEPEFGAVQIQRRAPAGFPQAALAAQQGPVTVSLHDCLACSGCVTSAETVLLQHQSASELLAQLRDPEVVVAVSLSPQSVASLAAAVGLPPSEVAGRLATLLRSLGSRAVFDTAWSRDVALTEAAAEFLQRHAQRAQQQVEAQCSMHSDLGGSEMDVDAARPPAVAGGEPEAGPLPMLASACPGWVCYAEKTHGDHVLPYISTAKSPQAVMGTLVKGWWAQVAGLQPERIYHCAVMPCYDKKLEASRDDFLVQGTRVLETDCVLATTELLDLVHLHRASLEPPPGQPAAAAQPDPLRELQPPQQQPLGLGGEELAEELARLPASPLDLPFSNEAPGGARWGVPGGSGGYLEHVFRTAARELYGRELPPGPLPTAVGRNADFRECVLEVDGRAVLRFAAAYGFRNIQGLMRRVKSGKCHYDFVEVMACPSGCLNGGGQLKPAAGESVHQLIERLENIYHSPGTLAVRRPEDSPAVEELYGAVVHGAPGSVAARRLLHTQYHRREKTVTAALADW